MIKRIAFLLISFFIASIHSSYSQQNCSVQNSAFKTGEELTYLVQYNWGMIWMDAAEAKFTITGSEFHGRPSYYITGTGSTFPKYDWFYKVRDKFESHVDTSSLKPFRYIRNSNEGGHRVYNDNYFYGSKNYVLSYSVGKDNKTKRDSLKISDCVFDVLSAIYYTRTIDFSKSKAGDKMWVELFLDGKVYKQQVTYYGKEVLTTKLGRFNCIKFKPTLIEGTIFKSGDEMTVWVTDDKNRLPLYVETPIVVGSIKVSLSDYKGLKNEITSKLD